MSHFSHIFPSQKPIIGMISLPPSLGYTESPGINGLVEAALADLEALERGGADGALIENDFDQPHTLLAGAEVIAGLTRVAHEIVARARIPVGVQVLLNDWRASLGIAIAAGAQFVRLDFFVDHVQIRAGVIEPEPEAVIAFRRHIRAEHIALLTDIQVKYSEPAGRPKPLGQSASEAAAAGADALIVTGPATGAGPTTVDLQAARAGNLPILIGSGLTRGNAAALFPLSDGAIVGTALRSGPTGADRVEERRVKELVEAWKALGKQI